MCLNIRALRGRSSAEPGYPRDAQIALTWINASPAGKIACRCCTLSQIAARLSYCCSLRLVFCGSVHSAEGEMIMLAEALDAELARVAVVSHGRQVDGEDPEYPSRIWNAHAAVAVIRPSAQDLAVHPESKASPGSKAGK